MKKEKKSNREIRKINLKYGIIMVSTLVAMVLFSLFGYQLMQRYEESVLRIYADQQDNYVQLVLDQINLQPEGVTEETIADIIETLDSGKSHFWTLSKDEMLLFVKNVTETDRYQGVAADKFYVTESGQAFFDGLQTNRVTHDIVVMEDTRYVASGTLFRYDNASYHLCLLTDETVILDNNDFLSVKITMSIYVIILLIALLLVTMIAETVVWRNESAMQRSRERIEALNRHVNHLEEDLKKQEVCNSRYNVYRIHMVEEFLQELERKVVSRGVFVRLHFDGEEQKRDFLTEAEALLDETVLRFEEEDGELLLLMVHFNKAQARSALERMGVTQEQLVLFKAVRESDAGLYRVYLKEVKKEAV